MQEQAWTPERVSLLRQLWTEGETAAAIAVRLGGISRSAVLGKIFRLRLAGPGTGEIAQKERSAAAPAQNAGDIHVARRRRSPKRAHQQQPSLNAAKRGKTLLELTNNTCRWPQAALAQKGSISAGHRRRIWSAAYPTAPAICAVPIRCSKARAAMAVRRRGNARLTRDEDACRHGVAALTSARSRHPAPPAGDAEEAEPTLIERAARAARSELRGERTGILGALGESAPAGLSRTRPVPERWSLVHVMERMEEAFRILARLPVPTGPRGYINSMPIHLYDRGDLNAQMETFELERMARLCNRVRIPPSPAEIARMEEALRWPTLFLSGAEFHHVARAVNLGSLWAAFDANVDERVKRLKITRRAFNARKLQGLRIIASELVRRRIPVR